MLRRQILFVKLLPSLRDRFLAYGSRIQDSKSAGSPKQADNTITASDRAAAGGSDLLNAAATLRVPHGWFASFYATSVALSIFWATQLVLQTPLISRAATSESPARPSMTLGQIAIAWTLMLVQGSRRLYECLYIAKSSSAQMWIGHWAVGILFYTGMSIAVWIEGGGEAQKPSRRIS